MACLDTTLLIDLVGESSGRREKAIRKIEELAERGEELVTTRFSLAELYVGVARSTHPEREEKAIHACLGEFAILDFTDAAARLFGSITGFLQQIGKPAGDMDVLIAATAMVHGHTLITRNPRHFRHIPQLVVEDY
jgi:predicted nucleic acid-binding protein